MKENRSLRNLIVHPQQLKLVLVTFAVSSLAFGLAVSAVISVMLTNLSTAASDFEIDPMFYQTMSLVVQKSAISIVLIGLVCMAILIYGLVSLAHRIYGPIVPIRKFLEQLKDGKYDARISLRSSDEFHELANDLNELAKRLESKS
jgi:sensor histidine kinase YesM